MLKFSLSWSEGDGNPEGEEPPGWMLEIEGEGDLEGRGSNQTLLFSEAEYAALVAEVNSAARP